MTPDDIPVEPDRREPAYERLARELRDQIISGELAPGDQLPAEAEMQRRYGVSRSTIREALRVLSSQNLLMTTRGVTGGSFVVRPEPRMIADHLQTSLGLLTSATGSVNDLLEVRSLMEVPAAGLAARRRTKDELEAVRATLFDPHDVDVDHMFQANRNFHGKLLSAAGNPVLEIVTRPIFAVLQERLQREEAGTRFWTRVDRDHREIFGYVESRDEQGAREAQAAHLDHLRSTYTRIDRAARGIDTP
jgi:DNA-binding FadR family transcriptional regulator